jgi:hypothetical protein
LLAMPYCAAKSMVISLVCFGFFRSPYLLINISLDK